MGQWIHIGTGFDKNYLKPFHALLGSLIENHGSDNFEIHAISDQLSDKEKKAIADRVRESGNKISFYEVDPALVKRFVISSQWTSVVYYRLFFSSLIPEEINRLLYLDCDTIVHKSLRQLYSMDLDGFPLGAVYDNYVKIQPHIGIVEEGEYFNSGVLLIDIEKWRRQQISERAFNYLLSHPERILFVDQCALNAVLKNNWKRLEERFNLMYSSFPQDISKSQVVEYLKQAVVIHYTLQRPWHMLCRNRLRHLYFYYLRRSGIQSYSFYCYSDFEVGKIPAWIKLRFQELYFDMPFMRRIWRSLQAK